MILCDSIAAITIPTQYVAPLAFGTAVAVIGWLFKGKTDRWDDAATRTHDHASHLQQHEIRIDHLEKAAKPPKEKS